MKPSRSNPSEDTNVRRGSSALLPIVPPSAFFGLCGRPADRSFVACKPIPLHTESARRDGSLHRLRFMCKGIGPGRCGAAIWPHAPGPLRAVPAADPESSSAAIRSVHAMRIPSSDPGALRPPRLARGRAISWRLGACRAVARARRQLARRPRSRPPTAASCSTCPRATRPRRSFPASRTRRSACRSSSSRPPSTSTTRWRRGSRRRSSPSAASRTCDGLAPALRPARLHARAPDVGGRHLRQVLRAVPHADQTILVSANVPAKRSRTAASSRRRSSDPRLRQDHREAGGAQPLLAVLSRPLQGGRHARRHQQGLHARRPPRAGARRRHALGVHGRALARQAPRRRAREARRGAAGEPARLQGGEARGAARHQVGDLDGVEVSAHAVDEDDGTPCASIRRCSSARTAAITG